MSELQRQHYLSALGIDTYMPRWQLPFAPVSVACEIASSADELNSTPLETNREPLQTERVPVSSDNVDVSRPMQTDNVLSSIFESTKNPRAQVVNAADILAQLNEKPANIESFSLSIWRPVDGLMIVDSRNSKLALPTELLLNNIIRSFFSNQSLTPKEEILRWPMIENSFAKRTANDARLELQTWLSVQHEIRSIRHLWLMGSNAATYLLPEQASFNTLIFHSASLLDSTLNALILPSLNDILQKPTYKQKIFAAIRRYHFRTL